MIEKRYFYLILLFLFPQLLSAEKQELKDNKVLVGEATVGPSYSGSSDFYARTHNAKYCSTTGYYTFAYEGSWEFMDQIILEAVGGVKIEKLTLVFRKKDGSFVDIEKKDLYGREKYFKGYESKTQGIYYQDGSRKEGRCLARIRDYERNSLFFFINRKRPASYKNEIVKIYLTIRSTSDYYAHSTIFKANISTFKLFLNRSKEFENFLTFKKAYEEQDKESLKKFFRKENPELLRVLEIAVREQELLGFNATLDLLSEMLKKDQDLKSLKKSLVEEESKYHKSLLKKKLKNLEKPQTETLIQIKRQASELFADLVRNDKEEEAIKKMKGLFNLGFTPDRRSYERAIVEGKASVLNFLFSFPEEFPALHNFKLDKDQGHYGSFLHLAVEKNKAAVAQVILERRPSEFYKKDDREPQNILQKKHATPEERLAEHWHQKEFHDMREVFRKFKRKMKQEARARKKAKREKKKS